MTMGIVEFLEARIAEDEARVDAIHSHATERYGGVPVYRNVSDSPSRILREVAAKRKIINDHRVGSWYVYTDDDTRACETCGDSTVRWPCATIGALAAIFSDHPDFNEEWRP